MLDAAGVEPEMSAAAGIAEYTQERANPQLGHYGGTLVLQRPLNCERNGTDQLAAALDRGPRAEKERHGLGLE
jgi:hypothetical protein